MIVKATTAAQDAYIESLTHRPDPAPPVASTPTPRPAPTRYRIGPACPTCGNTLHAVETT